MTSTYVSLATITLTSTDSEIVFSSIPATYRDLVLVTSGISTTVTGVTLRFNSDGGSNYSYVVMDGFGSGSGSSSATGSDSSINVAVVSGGISSATFQIQDYAQTNKHKSVLARVGSLDWGGVRAAAGRWANTNAINTIAFSPTNSRSFLSGSTFSLYGIN